VIPGECGLNPAFPHERKPLSGQDLPTVGVACMVPVILRDAAQTSAGQVRYQLKNAYRDGTTHIVLEPLDLMARLAALVPPPRMHLTRFHGVFAPHKPSCVRR
jgi:hypothetical protein